MNVDNDGLIAKKNAEFSPFCTRMERLRIDFIYETSAFASEWYKITAKEYVSRNAEHVLKMGDGQLLSMKSRINTLISNAEEKVKQVLDNPSLWWHLRPRILDAPNPYLQVDDKYPKILDDAVRHILGCLGGILQEYGFHVSVGGTGVYYEYWYVQSSVDGRVNPYYPHVLVWSIPMQGIIREYNTQYLAALAIYKEMELLKEQKKKQQALSLWDSF